MEKSGVKVLPGKLEKAVAMMMMVMRCREEDKPRRVWFGAQRCVVDEQTFNVRSIAGPRSAGV